jgi:uncharacterized protein
MLRDPAMLDRTLSSDERRLIADLAGRLRTRYGDRLERFVIFGSRARGDASEESDIDLLVLLEGPPESADREIAAAWELAGEAIKGTHTHAPLSLLVLSTTHFAELKRRERRFALDVEAEGILL